LSEASQARLPQIPDEQPTDVSRYVAAIRRGAWLIALIVGPLTLSVLALSLALPKTYSSVRQHEARHKQHAHLLGRAP
jgi:uncharacterized protein involved in exopolysaccharide biosynthesis